MDRNVLNGKCGIEENKRIRSTSENTLREFPLVIATVAKVSRKRGLWLVVRVNEKAGEIGWSYPGFIGFL